LAHAGEPLPRGVLRARLRVNNQRLGDILNRLDQEGHIVRTDRGWTPA
jgi:hypothetical protein